MSKPGVLLEGALYGHLSHLYDFSDKVPPLTFNQIEDIFTKVSQIKLEVGEKLDGQTIFITFVPHETDARGGAIVLSLARKADVLTAPEAIRDPGAAAGSLPKTIERFAGRNEELKNAFVDSLTALDVGIKALDLETQKAIFGPDDEGDYNWFAFEIMDPGNPNVINYDKYGPILALHVEGHATFSSKTRDKKINLSPSEEENGVERVKYADPVKLFKQAFERINQALEGKSRFKVIANEFRNLEKEFDASPHIQKLNKEISKLSRLGISKNSNIADFALASLLDSYSQEIVSAFRKGEAKNLVEEVNVKPLVSDLMQTLDKKTHGAHIASMEALVQSILDGKGRKRQILAGLDPDQKQRVESLLGRSKDIKKEILYPIEIIIHDFAVEALDKYESAYILSNGESAEKLQQAVDADIHQIQAAFSDPSSPLYGQGGKKAKFEKEKGKVRPVTTAAEGITFLYDGRFYKLTGNFAPINQILGMKPGKFLKEQVELGQNETYVFIPGGFKPPHADHWKLLVEPLEDYPNAKFTIIIGEEPRDGFTAAMSKTVWETMIQDKGISGDIRIVTAPIPVRYVYEQAAEASPGDTIIPVYGSARGADGRYDRLANYTDEGVELVDGGITTKSVEEGGSSGTMLRDLVTRGKKEEFFTYMPDLSDNAKNKIWDTLSVSSKILLPEIKSLIANLILEINAEDILAKIKDVDQSEEEIQNALQALETASSKNIQFKQTLQDIAKEIEQQELETAQSKKPTPAPQSKKIAVTRQEAAKQIKYAKIKPEQGEIPIEEMSSMAGGAVAGYSGPLFNKGKGEKKMDSKEKKLREALQYQINLIVRENIQQKLSEENKLRETIRNLLNDINKENKLRETIRNLTKEVITEQQNFSSEKEMFDLVKKEIAGVLKATIKILKSQQEGDPEQVQIGHLKATIIGLNNLFDQVEASNGRLDKLSLAEQKENKAKLNIEIGDVSGDVTQSPEYMSPAAMENGGDEKDIDIEDTGHEETEETTLDLTDDDIKTVYELMRESDPENASYQVLGASRSLDGKTGSWSKVKKIFLNYSEKIIEADLPKEAWTVFRKWVAENVRLHLIATVQETAGGDQTSGEEDLGMGDLGGQEPSDVGDLEF